MPILINTRQLDWVAGQNRTGHWRAGCVTAIKLVVAVCGKAVARRNGETSMKA